MKKNKAIRKYIREHKREGNPPYYPYYETWDEYFEAMFVYKWIYMENKAKWEVHHTNWDNDPNFEYRPVPGLAHEGAKGSFFEGLVFFDVRIGARKINVSWSKLVETEKESPPKSWSKERRELYMCTADRYDVNIGNTYERST